jgi:outer membrane lipoprotein SlyB
MNTNVYFPAPRATAASKTLWGAITVLGISTLAMGAALVQVHTGNADAMVHSAAAPTVQAVTALAPPTKAKESLRVASSSPKHTQPSAPTSTKPAGGSTAPAASNDGFDPQDRSPVRKVVSTPESVCQTCGTVESVTLVQRESAPVGVGAAAGAVLGGIVGNQVGQGDGKTVATILGVLGGGWAGHTVEKKMKVQTVYQVRVRMDDGTTRTLEQKTAPAVGSKVTVDGDSMGSAGVQTNRSTPSDASGTAI